ncbi:MAG: arginine deiminase-related protein [Bacteroidales bacterium]|nr:arginine deiminase-related protein [Bacteroidales bacterium]MDD2426437.1 arginine deiminase-related protein [Bacteroidales bacterium]MDD3990422.1 arginine deiminase-related protein [Bacteroidales bacterium]MDD4639604.1 arginine deiminase-related protein [Bacteroidales bacterium]
MQTTSSVLMIRPVNFGFNPQTAANNLFQKEGFGINAAEAAVKEFDNFVKLLQDNGVNVTVAQDTPDPHTPDSIFPNNWFSTHSDGTLVLYPMFAENRRLERKPHVIEKIKENFNVKRIVDLTGWEKKGEFLEGTGSMILDRENRLVYACSSPRTSEKVLEQFCDEMDYEYLLFDSFDSAGNPVYHTNVMMCVGSDFVVACLDSIRDIQQRESFINQVEDSGKELIEISLEQMDNFAGNMLEIRGGDTGIAKNSGSANSPGVANSQGSVNSGKGRPLLVMSKRAKESLEKYQLLRLESYCSILAPSLTVIENNGGGSARCMIAELFVS